MTNYTIKRKGDKTMIFCGRIQKCMMSILPITSSKFIVLELHKMRIDWPSYILFDIFSMCNHSQILLLILFSIRVAI